jgi:hypothetical protein
MKNLHHTKGAIRDFVAQGWATKRGEYHVTASVTEDIRKGQIKDKPSHSDVLNFFECKDRPACRNIQDDPVQNDPVMTVT